SSPPMPVDASVIQTVFRAGMPSRSDADERLHQAGGNGLEVRRPLDGDQVDTILAGLGDGLVLTCTRNDPVPPL
ncbi:MAG: hypothetical protein NTU78_00015, partial [Alphaproteobacteria bacterium]|nr:hypothetical protein [Alphaproteobacteria bacterium]